NFVLPGGSQLGAQLHVARTVCRRAERLLTVLTRAESQNSSLLIFLNRLSDLLFVLARRANRESGSEETLWVP
ncbi:MAG TPA: ATP:cob(I)alamin adenosyltransferase, partial [Bacteroidota bacterium]